MNKYMTYIFLSLLFFSCRKEDEEPVNITEEITIEIHDTIVNDIEGNSYSVIKIGDQIWMGENLKVTKYNDGSSIPNIIDQEEWINDSTGAYCNGDNSIDTTDKYGAIYNWYAVETEKLCPTDWHIPSKDEWTTLTNYAGGEKLAGNKLKSTYGWFRSGNGNNEFGFNALPAVNRDLVRFSIYQQHTSFWSSSLTVDNKPYAKSLTYGSDNFQYGSVENKSIGLSIRCIKN